MENELLWNILLLNVGSGLQDAIYLLSCLAITRAVRAAFTFRVCQDSSLIAVYKQGVSVPNTVSESPFID